MQNKLSDTTDAKEQEDGWELLQGDKYEVVQIDNKSELHSTYY